MALDKDQELEALIAHSFSPEQQKDLSTALAIFIGFSYGDVFEVLEDVVGMSEDEEAAITQSAVYEHIRRGLFSLCEMHRIHVNTTASIDVMNQILITLLRLPSVEDPVPYLRILESNATTNEEKTASIVAALSELPEVSFLDEVLEVNDKIILNMATLLSKREDAQAGQETLDDEMVALQARMVARLKAFFNLFGENATAFELTHSGISVAHPFGLYLPIVAGQIKTDDIDQTALNILSVFLISIDAFEDPGLAYREYSETLLGDATLIGRVEASLIKHVSALRAYEESLQQAAAVQTV